MGGGGGGGGGGGNEQNVDGCEDNVENRVR